MNRVLAKNPNTVDYWEKVYEEEGKSGKIRVDDRRFDELMRWLDVRGRELGRKPHLLDGGCGLADILKKARARNKEFLYTGVDISPSTISMCRSELERDGSWFMTGSVSSLPYPDETFDVAWCGETLEHLEEPDMAIRELSRVVREGSLIVISTPYKRRNSSPEHVWEFDPWDIIRWSVIPGELVFLDTLLLPEWLTMFAVFRRSWRTHFT